VTLVRWYGQSAFLVEGSKTVFIDPFGDMSRLADRGIAWDYPPIEGVSADLLLVTHEHGDHNAVDVIGGDPALIRSTAGTHESPVGEVISVASEHDDAAGTKRGANTLVRFELDGLVYCHLGDLGQVALRPEQAKALGAIDVLFIPVGDGPTIGGERAAAVVRELKPRLVFPKHYRTEAIGFLDPPDAFLDALGARVERFDSSEVEVERVLGTHQDPTVVLLAPPLG
jgi:L-ascorbate metabolism protein UlaG (beta-lactamase superfamily)